MNEHKSLTEFIKEIYLDTDEEIDIQRIEYFTHIECIKEQLKVANTLELYEEIDPIWKSKAESALAFYNKRYVALRRLQKSRFKDKKNNIKDAMFIKKLRESGLISQEDFNRLYREVDYDLNLLFNSNDEI